jgi:hypothetical protein
MSTREMIAVGVLWVAGITLAITLGIIGGAEGQAHKTPSTHNAVPTTAHAVPGGNFLPWYVNALHNGQLPRMTCEPTDLASLMVPCDTP